MNVKFIKTNYVLNLIQQQLDGVAELASILPVTPETEEYINAIKSNAERARLAASGMHANKNLARMDIDIENFMRLGSI